MGKSAMSSSFSPCWEAGEGRWRAGGVPHRRSGPRGRPGGGGKEGERLKGSIPPLDFGKGGPQGGDLWRRAAAAMVALRWGFPAAKVRRESEGETRRF